MLLLSSGIRRTFRHFIFLTQGLRRLEDVHDVR